MINKSHRFHGPNSLRFVLSRGKVVRQNNIALKYIFNKQQSSYRVAVVVSKKVSKSAVVRNRIRRRIYEAVRLYPKNITEPIDLVFFVYSQTLKDTSFKEIQAQINHALSQVNK